MQCMEELGEANSQQSTVLSVLTPSGNHGAPRPSGDLGKGFYRSSV